MPFDIDAGMSVAKRDSLPLAVLMRDVFEREAGVDRPTHGPEVMNDKLSAGLGKSLGDQHDRGKIGSKLRDRRRYDIADSEGEPQAPQGLPYRMIKSSKIQWRSQSEPQDLSLTLRRHRVAHPLEGGGVG